YGPDLFLRCAELRVSWPVAPLGGHLHLLRLDGHVRQLSALGRRHSGWTRTRHAYATAAVLASAAAYRWHCRGAGLVCGSGCRPGRLLGVACAGNSVPWDSATQLCGLVRPDVPGACSLDSDRSKSPMGILAEGSDRFGSSASPLRGFSSA